MGNFGINCLVKMAGQPSRKVLKTSRKRSFSVSLKDGKSLALIKCEKEVEMRRWFYALVCILVGWNISVAGESKIYKKKQQRHFDVTPLQGLHFGIISQAPLYCLSKKPFDKYATRISSTMGFGYGVTVNYFKEKTFGFHAQVIYTDITQKYQNVNKEGRSVEASYLEVPLLVSLNTNYSRKIIFNVAAGPELGVLAGSTFLGIAPSDYINVNSALSLSSIDIGLGYSGGMTMYLGESSRAILNAGLRGVYGNTNCIGLYAGVMFKL